VPEFYSICVIGAGGIGADTILTAGKMGFDEILIYDDDEVDGVNIATQFHKFSDIGKPKVDAIGDAVFEYSGAVAVTVERRVTPETVFPFPVQVVISAVDSIKARQDIWQAVLVNTAFTTGPAWYIDCRMAAMEFHMYVIDMSDERVVAAYNQELMAVREEDIEELPCTEKSTTFLAKIAAGHVGAELMHIIKDEARSRFLVHNINTQFLHVRAL